MKKVYTGFLFLDKTLPFLFVPNLWSFKGRRFWNYRLSRVRVGSYLGLWSNRKRILRQLAKHFKIWDWKKEKGIVRSLGMSFLGETR